VPAQVHLLPVRIEAPFGKQLRARQPIFGQQPHLRQFGGLPHHGLETLASRDGRFAVAAAEQPGRFDRHVAKRRAFVGHHVRVEFRRATDRLAGVVDDEVEAVTRRQEVAAERLHARRVAQIEADDLEAVAPIGEIGLGGVADGRITRESRGHDHVRARAEQFQPGLVPDLDPPARQQRHATAEVGQFGPRREIDRRARRAELVV
jgi:hypothetical protein